MKKYALIYVILLTAIVSMAGEPQMDWAYHDDADAIDDRSTERVPGTTYTFLSHDSADTPTSASISLYVLTLNQFAGAEDEQVFVRWWNGEKEHWVAAEWVQNMRLGGDSPFGTFHGLPISGEAVTDVWKATIPAEMTMPGDNYYVIQLKARSEDSESVRYLLRKNGEQNNLEQMWTDQPDYAGKDWHVTITE